MKKIHILYLTMFASLFWFLRTNLVDLRQVGIGFVEVVLPTFYLGFHLPLAIETAVTLTFRTFSFWLPIFIGFIAVRRLHLFRSARILNSVSSNS